MTQHQPRSFRQVGQLSLGLIFLLMICGSGKATSQIVPDHTLPNNSSVDSGCIICTINGGTPQGRILFHSFDKFSIPTNGEVRFNNELLIRSIVTRVTGSQSSEVDGLVTANGSANLFLINPNGITFGPNAQLRLGGSFIASTANSFLFPGGGQFNTTNPTAPPILDVQVEAPIGLQFEGKPNSIQVQNAQLTTRAGKTLALIGGQVNLSGSNFTGNHFELGGISDSGAIGIQPYISKSAIDQDQYNDGFTFVFDKANRLSNVVVRNTYIGNEGFGGADSNLLSKGLYLHSTNLELYDHSRITASITESQEIDGQKQQRLGNLIVGADGSISLHQSSIDMKIKTSTVAPPIPPIPPILLIPPPISAEVPVSFNPPISSNTVSSTIGLDSDRSTLDEVSGTRPAPNFSIGSIIIRATFFSLSDQSSVEIATSTPRSRNIEVGGVSIDVEKTLNMDDSAIALSLGVGGQLGSEALEINAGDLIMTNSASISTSIPSSGNDSFGNIVEPQKAIDINVNVQRSAFIDNSQILSSAGFGDIGSGNILFNAGKISLIGGARVQTDNPEPSIFFGGKSPIGRVEISAERLQLTDEGTAISASTNTTDNAGQIFVKARDLSILNFASIRSNTQGDYTPFLSLPLDGRGGDIDIRAQGIRIANQGNITVSSEGSGKGGNVTIFANRLSLENGGEIVSRTTRTDSGNITLNVRNLLLLRNQGKISATAGVSKDGGTGGNIAINAANGFIVAVPKENSDITANAFSGRGGKVEINAQAIFGLAPLSRSDLEALLGTVKPEELDPQNVHTSNITAISQQNPSLNGQVSLNASVNPDQRLGQTPQEPRTTEVVDSCQISTDGKEAVRFYDIGRGGLPIRPDDPLSIDLLEWSSLDSTVKNRSPLKTISQTPQHSSKQWSTTSAESSKLFTTNVLRLVMPCQSL